MTSADFNEVLDLMLARRRETWRELLDHMRNCAPCYDFDDCERQEFLISLSHQYARMADQWRSDGLAVA